MALRLCLVYVLSLMVLVACKKNVDKAEILVFEETFLEKGEWKIYTKEWGFNVDDFSYFEVSDTVNASSYIVGGTMRLSSSDWFGEGYSAIAFREYECASLCDEVKNADSLIVELDVKRAGGSGMGYSSVDVHIGNQMIRLTVEDGANYTLIRKFSTVNDFMERRMFIRIDPVSLASDGADAFIDLDAIRIKFVYLNISD